MCYTVCLTAPLLVLYMKVRRKTRSTMLCDILCEAVLFLLRYDHKDIFNRTFDGRVSRVVHSHQKPSGNTTTSAQTTNHSFQVSLISVGNSIQAYSTLTYTREIYGLAPHQVTSLSGRTFGTWTFLSSIIRLYAALNIHDPLVFQLALATYGVAWLHFVSEWVGFGTARWGRALAGPVVVSTGTLAWMLSTWGSYVQ